MGAWDTGSFDNDDALDWLGDFAAAPSIVYIKHILRLVTVKGDVYLEVTQSSTAIAAAEVVATLNGYPPVQSPETLHVMLELAQLQADQESLDLALVAVKRIKADSELQALWQEHIVEYPRWLAAVTDLETRLQLFI